MGDVLYRLTDHVVQVLGIEGAGVSLGMFPDALRFVAATEDRVARIEAGQVDSGDGPCFEAYRSGGTVMCGDLKEDGRWPHYRDIALQQDIRTVAGIPMPVGDERIGALNLYETGPRKWSGEELDTAQLQANVASGYIVNRRCLDEQTTLARQLQHALDSRVVIEQAKGVLSGRKDIDVAQAFEILRSYSRANSTKIHEVARRVITGELQL